jgi:catechol 2,3-dioxygenase-like lactoylglutathione lyase family enzyme
LTDDDVKEVRRRLINAGVEMVNLGNEISDQGTVIRTGARGKLRSVYCRDPDGNLIEWVLLCSDWNEMKIHADVDRISNYI